MRKLANKQNESYHTIREGDWICLNCNNLNFSFRDLCNRCKIQTKQANYSYYSFYLTVPQVNIEQSFSPIPAEKQCKDDKWQDHQQTKLFQSVLLLTPTKQNIQNGLDGDQPYKSPGELPSISPILKSYNRRLEWEQLMNQTKYKSHSRTAIAIKTSRIKQITITSFAETEDIQVQDKEQQRIYSYIEQIMKDTDKEVQLS